MDSLKQKQQRKKRLRRSVKKRIKGTSERPRLVVFRSNKEIYGQIIDDYNAHTLVASSSLDEAVKQASGTKKEIAQKVGELLGQKAKEANISKVVFDRNVYLYHGRVKALAEGAREAGLEF